MSVDRSLLARYLRQLAELGITEIPLDGMTAAEALAALSGRVPPQRSRPPNVEMRAGHAVGEESDRRVVAPVTHVRDAPAAARGLQVLAEQAAGCGLCRLHADRSTVVFGEGSADADLVVVGEAPGQEEDRSGRPFVGRAGKLLDLMLASVGFPRSTVYICNVLKCRPPNNRNPLPDEIEPCTTNFLHGQIDAIKPRVLLAVGTFAARALLASEESIGSLRGRVHAYRGTPLIATYHPAYLLRSPQMTRAAWQDYQLIRRVLDEQA